MDETLKKREFIGFIGFFYALPILLLYFDVIPFRAYYAILLLMGLVLAAYSIQQGISAEELGFVRRNLVPALLYAVPFTVFGIILIVLASKFNLYRKVGTETVVWYYFFYLLVSAPVQEFIFRSLMLHELKMFFRGNKVVLILLSALLFALAHIFFHSLGVLAATFVAGVIWAWIFEHRPNFWAIWISHATLGAVAIAFHFI